MSGEVLICAYLVALAGLLGLEVIRKAPPSVHATRLAAGGALGGLSTLAGFSLRGDHPALEVLGTAIGAAAVVGGLLGARRMLR
jgi:hypothetical protein